jgi:hypothetical protein
MASNFSVWLRETARLYLRYMAVGLVSLPFAFVLARAAQVGWNLRILLPVMGGCGFGAAFWVWRRMGSWQIKPKVERVFEDSWVALLTNTMRKVEPLQYRVSVDGDAMKPWNELLASSFLVTSPRKFEIVIVNCTAEPASVQMLTQPAPSSFQQMLSGQRTHPRPSERTPRAPLFPEGQHVHAHGLA